MMHNLWLWCYNWSFISVWGDMFVLWLLCTLFPFSALTVILLIQFSSAFTFHWKALCHNYCLPASVPKILCMAHVICFINLVYESVISWQGCSCPFFGLTFSCLYKWLHKSLLIIRTYVIEKRIVRHESSYFAFLHHLRLFFWHWMVFVSSPSTPFVALSMSYQHIYYKHYYYYYYYYYVFLIYSCQLLIRWLSSGASRSQQEIKQFTPALYECCMLLLLLLLLPSSSLPSSSSSSLSLPSSLLFSKYSFPFCGCEVLTALLEQIKVFWYMILFRFVYSSWLLEELAASKSLVLRPWRWRWNVPSECWYLSYQAAWSHIDEDCVHHSCCSENLISYLIFCTFKCTATSLPILFIVFEINQLVCIVLRYLVRQQSWLSSEEESVINVADSSSSMDMSTYMSSSLDWSQPITRAEESLELKWDDDENKSDDDDDDQSQRPLELKVNPTNTVDQPIDGKLCYDVMTWVWH